MGTEKVQTDAAEQVPAETYSVIAYTTDPFPEQYKAYVYSKWMRAARHGNDFFKLVVPDSYWRSYRRLLDLIFERAETRLRLAVLSGQRDIVLGFSVTRGPILDFVYVNKDFRRLGIATSLIPPGIQRFTHLTNTALRIWNAKGRKLLFDPFA